MPDSVDLGLALSLPPKAAIAYFESKGYAISWNWQDVWQEAQAIAFTAAKVTRLDVLQDIRDALTEALKEGRTERWFESQLIDVLQRKGWWGRQQMEVAPGESEILQLGSPARLRLIYRQNLQTAYMAARWKQMMDNVAARPWWQYVAVLDSATRPSHRALSGKVFRYDDPIWATIYPPNAFNCRCRVRALSSRDLERKGLIPSTSDGARITREVSAGIDRQTGEIRYVKVSGLKLRAIDADGRERDVEFLPDPGFSYNPGEAAHRPDRDKYARDLVRLLDRI